jgi:DNA-binding CsgD family transcriptional regulator
VPGARGTGDHAPLPGLTPAEQAVTRLAAGSWSNRQTAAELDISVMTVEFHLGRTFD